MKTTAGPFTSAVLLGSLALVAAPSTSVAQPAADTDQGIEAYVSEDALQGLYTRRMDVGDLGTGSLHAGIFLNEQRDTVILGDLLTDVADPGRFQRWSFQVGPRAYGVLLSTENQDIFGAGLGGRARFTFGGTGPVSLHLTAFYAPDILTFGAADGIRDVSFRIELAMNPDLTGFVGYRILEIDLEGPVANKRLDDGVHLGLRRRF